MATVIFIDIDGPLLPQRAWFLPNNVKLLEVAIKSGSHPFKHPELQNIVTFDPVAVSFFNTWTQNKDIVGVISSNWFHYETKEQIETIFKNNGLNIQLHKDWHTPRKEGSNRLTQIKHWLDIHIVDDFVIVDDDPCLVSPNASVIIPNIDSKLVYVRYDEGITVAHHSHVCSILNVPFPHNTLPRLTFQ